MLMDIKCSAVASIKVCLKFDDGSVKENIVSVGDLVSVLYNANGLRKRIDGKVIKVSAVGADPKGWYIIVDGSDDFESTQARFSPMSILDLDIIRKGDTLEIIQTPYGDTGIPYLRIVKGRLQFSKDGLNWHPIIIDERDIIQDQEGTVPINPSTSGTDLPDDDGDGIEDAIY